jgi:hypothetical protein
VNIFLYFYIFPELAKVAMAKLAKVATKCSLLKRGDK